MKRPQNIGEWLGEFIAAWCVVFLPLALLFIGSAINKL